MSKLGIDISVYQGEIDLSQAMSEGVEFAIIKGGGGDDGLYVDRQFARNYDLAKSLKLPIGCYWFSRALTTSDAKTEAAYFYENVLKGRSFELPVYIDVENKSQLSIGKDELTSVIKEWCSSISGYGFRAGIYSSLSYFKNYMNDSELSGITHWVAQYHDKCEYEGSALGMWQFGGSINYLRSPKIAGVTCDQNYMIQDLISSSSESAKVVEPVKAPIKKREETTIVELPVLTEGMSGPAVHAAMVLMKAKGYYDGFCDDLFGPNMKNGLGRMQEENGLGKDYIFGNNSWTFVLLK